MTTLVCWVGVDSHGPTSIYIASDSRISWDGKRWDYGRKIYASKTSPDLLAFCGTVAFPSQVLGQLIEQIENGLLFEQSDPFELKLDRIEQVIKRNYKSLPLIVSGDFTVIYASRSGVKKTTKFNVAKIIGRPSKSVESEILEIPTSSDVIIRSGSGRTAFLKKFEEWVGDPRMKKIRTSRAVFGALCESISSGSDPYSGGAPQLVGLYRSGGNGNNFGVIYDNKRYLYGTELEDYGLDLSKINWHNELFERCCGKTMTLKGKAQRQPKVT